jgi:hypothetical protein
MRVELAIKTKDPLRLAVALSKTIAVICNKFASGTPVLKLDFSGSGNDGMLTTRRLRRRLVIAVNQ